MAIASMIVQPVSQKLEQVIVELAAITGITVHTTTPKEDIIIIVEADSLNAVEVLARYVEQLDGVLGVYPSYVTTADEETE